HAVSRILRGPRLGEERTQWDSTPLRVADQPSPDFVADAFECDVQVRLLPCEELLIGHAEGGADFAVYLQAPAGCVDCRVDWILRHDVELVVRSDLVREKLSDSL